MRYSGFILIKFLFWVINYGVGLMRVARGNLISEGNKMNLSDH